MAMIHHDNRPYDVAVSEAAKKFKERLEERFHASIPRVEKVIAQVQNDVPQDMIAVGNKLAFEAKENALALIPPQSEALILHPHALRQVAEKAKVRNLASFVTELKGRGQWGAELIAENLNRIYSHMNGDRYLVRQLRGEVRGFLSDQYRRLDGHEMLDAFVGAMQQYGARPIDGFALQTKISVRCFLPMIFEPFPGEIVAVGAELTDSDYGDGFLTLNGILERMWCTNLATTTDVLKQVHLGKRLPQNIRLSDETYRLDTKAMASLINDLASNVLGPDAVNQYLAFIRQANEQKIDAHAITGWIKQNLNKGEGEMVLEKFNSPDVEFLPAGNTTWRWSNALSWLANETKDDRRKLELQDAAGVVLQPAKKPMGSDIPFTEAQVVEATA